MHTHKQHCCAVRHSLFEQIYNVLLQVPCKRKRLKRTILALSASICFSLSFTQTHLQLRKKHSSNRLSMSNNLTDRKDKEIAALKRRTETEKGNEYNNLIYLYVLLFVDKTQYTASTGNLLCPVIHHNKSSLHHRLITAVKVSLCLGSYYWKNLNKQTVG